MIIKQYLEMPSAIKVMNISLLVLSFFPFWSSRSSKGMQGEKSTIF